MNKILKAGILLIILAIPAFVFIFLHGFGENRFEIPVYYQDGIDTTFASCDWETPHIVNIDGFAGKTTVVGFGKEQLKDLNRLGVDYEQEGTFQTFAFTSEESDSNRYYNSLIFKQTGDLSSLLACSFVVNESTISEYPLILVDTEQRIRGYYYISDVEEFERLIHELNIIFENLK